MILALSASEMHRSGLHEQTISLNRSFDPGLHHYTLGLADLHSCIKEERQSTNQESVEAAIVALFFMVHYELQFSVSMERVKMHIQGLYALINSHPLFQQQATDGPGRGSPGSQLFNPHLTLSCQVIAWILSVTFLEPCHSKNMYFLTPCRHLDISATTAGASSSLLNLLTNSSNPTLHPRRLTQISRLGSPLVWGDSLPGHQLLAEIEIHRPVEFGFEIFFTRFNIWDFKERGSADGEAITPSSLLNTLVDLGEVGISHLS